MSTWGPDSRKPAAHRAPADLTIATLATLGPLAEPLRAEAEMRRIDFVRRLFEDHATGANRFDRPGERLLGAWQGARLVGVGGLNRDPYVSDDGIGRLRHVYVLASHRRLGVGTLLVRALLRQAEGRFRVVRLRTASAEAAAFYGRLGFHESAEPGATHLVPISAPRRTMPSPPRSAPAQIGEEADQHDDVVDVGRGEQDECGAESGRPGHDHRKERGAGSRG